MPWYDDAPLLYHLEHVVIAPDRNLADVRFPVQWVMRPMSEEHHDYRGYAGQVAGGVLRPGDEVVVLPSGQRTRIEAIDTYEGEVDAAFPNMSVTLRLADDLDISRGDMIVEADDQPTTARELDAIVCWMDEQAHAAGRPLLDQAHDPRGAARSSASSSTASTSTRSSTSPPSNSSSTRSDAWCCARALR